MRGIIRTVAAGIAVLTAFAAFLFFYALCRSPIFEQGVRHEFYTGDSAAQTVCSDSRLVKLLLPDVTGESVRYRGDLRSEIKEKFSAEVLFTERAAGVINYYCSSPLLQGGVELNGVTVNLHIAYDGKNTAAGTPLIFGGY